MIEQGKISPLQLAVLMYPVIAATGDLVVPAITASDAKRDMWLSPIWASLAGFLIVYVAYRLNALFPKETLIQYCGHILGKVPGKIVGLLFLFILLYDSGFILWEYAEFIINSFLDKTPAAVVLGSMTIVCAFAVRGGIEVLARTAQIIVPVVIASWLLIVLLLLPDYQAKNLMPFMENGAAPSLKGAVSPEVWFSLYFLTAFLLPYSTDRRKAMKWGMISVACVMLMLSLLNVSALLVFGDLNASLAYPLMQAAQYVSIADFLEHIESLSMAIWVASVFVKLSVFYYVLVISAAQWLGLSDHKPITLPVGILLVVFSLWSFSSLEQMSDFSKRIVPLYENTFYMLIPMALLLFAWFRRRQLFNK